MSELIERPAFLPTVEQGGVTKGLESANDLQILNFLKIMQGSSKGELSEKYPKGDVITVPEQIKVASKGEIFHFYPVFFYREWTLQNPYGIDPFIVEKTRDKTSDLARRAMSRDPRDREIPCPQDESKVCKYAEQINFVIVLDDHNESIGMNPLVMSFSIGEWVRGVSFKNKVNNRGMEHMCANRFQAATGVHKAGSNEWYGFDIDNPIENPYCTDEALYLAMVKLHEDLKAAYEAGGVQVDYDAARNEENKPEADERF